MTRAQILTTIRTLARRRGYDGDPFHPVPTIGPPALEFIAECLVLDAGIYANQPAAKRFARRLARGIVYSSTRRRVVA